MALLVLAEILDQQERMVRLDRQAQLVNLSQGPPDKMALQVPQAQPDQQAQMAKQDQLDLPEKVLQVLPERLVKLDPPERQVTALLVPQDQQDKPERQVLPDLLDLY